MHSTTLLQLMIATACSAMAKSHQSLSPRGDGAITCGTEHMVHMTQERESFVEGQGYLRSGIVCGSAAGHCSRISCSNDAAVWLCNNSGADINNMDCSIAADYIDHIFDMCQADGQNAVDFCSGTQENTDGWTIEVGWNNC